MPTSPTVLSMKRLRDAGFVLEKVERWNHVTKTRHDLFGFMDILALRENPPLVLGVQATTRANARSRIAKILGSEFLPTVLAAGISVEVWGWQKRGRRWELVRWAVGERAAHETSAAL